MITDPLFYAAAIPALLIFGISKGGFGTGLGIVAVPLIALTIPASRAAAIMLPILCVMDLAAMWAYRGQWSRENMKIMLPGGLAGIVLGALTFRYVNEAGLKLMLGAISIGFLLQRWLSQASLAETTRPTSGKGYFWSTVSGYTSTLAHAGGPPMSIYLLPQKMDKALLVGTTVVFFAIVNFVKLIPYTLLGLFDGSNLATSAGLAPVGLLGIFCGVWLRKIIPEGPFYRLCYAFLLVAGIKLLYDGAIKLI
ncbi:MAG: sulfite exporter TauE/SafE family protein [Burkholderiales bacterium]|nr:sulfite exporter TauE/SafE family protein [Burkholderiales bacterium]